MDLMSVDIKIEGITKIYDKNTALNNINLQIEKGEFVCLLGPSGCGKTTLLRLIAGLDTPTSGSIYINGKDMTYTPTSKRNFGIVFQSYALFPNLTAFENVAYGLENRKMPIKVINEKVENLFKMINLTFAKDRYPSQLSGGEQQRVALARALAVEPDFLLLDEPLSALDAKVRLKLRREICSIQRELGITTIMVTHDQDEALTMADKIIVMNRAEVMQKGSPIEIYQNPKNSFVADFIGAINFIDKNNTCIGVKGKKDLLAVRPEKINISLDVMEDGMPVTIENMEFRGSHYRLITKAHTIYDTANIMVDISFMEAEKLKLIIGKEVYLKIPKGELLEFDRM